MKGQAFLKHAAVYGVANLLLQAAGFVLLPLYTRCLGPRDFGVLEILGRLGETVSACLFIGGLRQALLTHYQQADGPAEKARVVSAAHLLVGIVCAAGGGLALVLAVPLDAALAARGHGLGVNLVRLAVLTVLLEPLTVLPLALLQARFESVGFVLATLGQFLLRVALTVVLVAWAGLGVAGVLAATALTSVLVGLGLSAREITRHAAWPEWRYVVSLLRFALPFLPGGLCFFVLHYGDRFLLVAWHGEEAVGVYGVGYKLALAVSMFSLAPLHMVWGARMYRAAREPNAAVVFGRVLTRLLAAFAFVGVGLCLFADEVVRLLGGRAFAPAAGFVLPVTAACFCQAAATLTDAAFYIRRRPGRKLGVSLATTAVMLALYFLLIPPLGGLGAALATLGGFAFLAVCTWLTARRLFPVAYEWRRLTTLVLTAALVLVVGGFLPPEPWAWPLKAGLWLAAPAALWALGVVTREEKAFVAGLWRNCVPLILGAPVPRARPVDERSCRATEAGGLLLGVANGPLSDSPETPEDALAVRAPPS
jgi:O-antigen/teichoic acid export membrane protein